MVRFERVMIGDIKGYCKLKSTEHCFIGYNRDADPKGYEDIKAELMRAPYVRITDIAVDGSGFLCIEPKGRALVDVRSMDDVERWFECRVRGEVVLPKMDDEAELMVEMGKRLCRKGGYNRILKGMVILNSLRVGEFNDDFLFERQ